VARRACSPRIHARCFGTPDRPSTTVLRVVTTIGTDSDEALVAAVQAREPRAAGRVWDRHTLLVRRILQRMLGPSADVEDAL